MAFAPYSCSTPKFVPVMNQPSHFVLSGPIIMKKDKQRQISKPKLHSYCRPLKKCSRFPSQHSNASTAINRQQQFDNDITIHNNQRHIFSCLPFNFFHISKRRRHGPCHV